MLQRNAARHRHWRASVALIRMFACMAMGTASAILSVPALAQAWPSKPVRIIVPFPAGNAGDVTARTLTEPLGQRLGQAIIVDNRPGAAGNIGMEAVKKSAPDGYTLLVTSLSPLVVNPVVMKSLPYDPIKDFQPVARIGWTGLMLVANTGFPANSVQELVSMAKAAPGKYNYAHIGAGTLSHLTMELFLQAAGINVVGIPYKGSSQAAADLMGGQLQFAFEAVAGGMQYLKGGKLKALAISSTKRLAQLPDLPTVAESGVPGFEATVGHGACVTSKTPPALVTRLNQELVATLKIAEVRERLAGIGAEVVGNTPEEAQAAIRAEIPRWEKIVKEVAAKSQ